MVPFLWSKERNVMTEIEVKHLSKTFEQKGMHVDALRDIKARCVQLLELLDAEAPDVSDASDTSDTSDTLDTSETVSGTDIVSASESAGGSSSDSASAALPDTGDAFPWMWVALLLLSCGMLLVVALRRSNVG